MTLGTNAILFGSSDCNACLMQIKMLMNHFGKKGVNIEYYNLKMFPAPKLIMDSTGNYSMPTWWLPNKSGGGGKLHVGVINDKKKFPSLLKKGMSFGSCGSSDNSIPQINQLAQCGKNFPDGKGMEISSSYMESLQSIWGKGSDVLNAGVGGTRSLGPNRVGEIYSNNFVNDIRMAQPAGQLGTALRLNRECNYQQNKVPQFQTPGMIYDSQNPQIVGFGRKTRFGGNEGPAYGKGYLMDKNTVKSLYGGGINDNYPRPYGVKNSSYIGSAPLYNPIKSKQEFGKKKVGEGSVLSIGRKNKIKVR